MCYDPRFNATWVYLMFTNALASLLLSPLLVTQGLITRARVPRWQEPPGPRKGKVGTGPRLRLLIVGDSAGAGVGVSHQQEALSGQVVSGLKDSFLLDWELDAVTGATTASTLERLEGRPAERFDVVVTSLGVNDVVAHVPRRTWLARQARLRRMLKDRFSAQLVIVSGLPPMHGFPALPQPLRWHLGWLASAFDHALQEQLSFESDCRFLSLRFTDDLTAMSGDGFHPGARVYAEWGRRVADLIGKWSDRISMDAGSN